MKSIKKRLLSLFLSLAMTLPLLITGTVAASTATTAAKTDLSAIDRVVVDFRDEESFAESMAIYQHNPTTQEPDPYTGGKYSWNDELEAMHVEYSASDVQKDFRIMPKFLAQNRISDKPYMVLVYRVDTTGKYNLTLWNSMKAGDEIYIEKDGKGTNGSFVISEPFDISKENDRGSIIKRWNAGNINTLAIDSADVNLKFYVKEMVFFKTAEDAKTYYANVDISEKPPVYDPDALDYSTLPDPVAIRFEGGITMAQKGTGFYTNNKDMSPDCFDTVTVDGEKVVKLNYVPYDKCDAYRIMPKFLSANTITAQHKYIRVVYMTTDTIANELYINANDGGGQVKISSNTSESRGKWVVSDAILIEGAGSIQQRWIDGKHNTLFYSSTDPDSKIYIKEIVFFSSIKQAGEYYGDDAFAYQAMTFGPNGNAAFTTGENYGNHSVNSTEGTLDIVWADSTNMGASTHFMAKIKFSDAYLADSNKYIRILYEADIPTNEKNVQLFWKNDNGGDTVIFSSSLKDTDGKYVLSKTVEASAGLMGRLSGSKDGQNGRPMHASLCMTSQDPNAKLRVKAIYFFSEKTIADAFEYHEPRTEITIGGKPLSNFKIVISADAGDRVLAAAELISSHLKSISGIILDIVTDDTPVSDCEILIGNTNREASKKLYSSIDTSDHRVIAGDVSGSVLAIGASLPPNICTAVNEYMRNHLYLGITAPEKLELNESNSFRSLTNSMSPANTWEFAENVKDPEVFTDDFDTDDGYWQEEANTSAWSFENGTYTVDAKELELTYIHVYEKDAKLSADLKVSGAKKDATFGLMLRYCAADAYVKAGYDFESDEWFIESREGNDFDLVRGASVKAEVKEGTVYNVSLTVDDDNAILTVDGKDILTAKISQLTMGRVAMFAEGLKLTADNAELTLISGQGTILKNITHLKIENNAYTEGGSATVLNDGTVIFEHSAVAMRSTDNGYTWEKSEKVLGVNGYPNILRLANGELLRANVKEGGNQVAQVSTDEGKTWTTVGIICPVYWNGTDVGGGNMNDKLTQAPSNGRIFFGMNYEGGPVDGRRVFCEFYYSDDNGRTWTKSETDSWTIEGNEKAALFGEAKLIECADGTIRMYGSWHEYGCLVYSESKDGGKTFGPLVKMEDFQCARSSVQFVRDPYAENPYTYYMVWVNSPMFIQLNSTMSRAAITLAKSEDGKNWEVIGDIWRWESAWLAPDSKNFINHVVDPFVQVTETTIIVGSGISEQIAQQKTNDYTSHQSQREHLWTLDKKANAPAEQLYKFTDVDTKDSFYDAVKYAVDKGLFNGTSETTFEPYTTMNRAMFVTVLARLESAQVDNNTATEFTDVKVGEWYTGSVAWAAKNGIVNGMGNGIYGVTGTITVEQACTILYRYNGGKTSDNLDGAKVTDFTDNASVSAWAADGVKWAVENGIYEGTNNKLNPGSAASRALVATMFANYVKAFG